MRHLPCGAERFATAISALWLFKFCNDLQTIMTISIVFDIVRLFPTQTWRGALCLISDFSFLTRHSMLSSLMYQTFNSKAKTLDMAWPSAGPSVLRSVR